MQKLPFDLAGCKVVKVNWRPQGMQMTLSGETADAVSVAGAQLTFQNVANLYALEDFMKNLRRIEEKRRTIEKMDRYPLKLPCILTQLKLTKAAQANYGEPIFTQVHGRPPKADASQQTFLFALVEKRFKDRKPFPIICEGITLTDKKGNLLAGAVKPVARHWSEQEYAQLGLRFFAALAAADQEAALAMLSPTCRKKFKPVQLVKVAGEIWGVAERLAKLQPKKIKGKAIDWFRPQMQVTVEVDERMVWEYAQSANVSFPRDTIRASLDLACECLRESIGAYIVEEDGQPWIAL